VTQDTSTGFHLQHSNLQLTACNGWDASSCEFLQVRCKMTYVLQATMTMTMTTRMWMKAEMRRSAIENENQRERERERGWERGRRHYRQISSAACIKNLKHWR